MILELLRMVNRERPGVGATDARATPPVLNQGTRRASIGDKTDYTGIRPGWDAQPRSASSGFADGSQHMPSAGADYGNRVIRQVEFQIFSEGGEYLGQPNASGGGNTPIYDLEQAIATNWIIDLTADATIRLSRVQDISEWELEFYGDKGRARFSPMTVSVHHHGFKFTLSNVILGTDEELPETTIGRTVFTCVYENHPGDDDLSGWLLLGIKSYPR